MRLLHQVSKPEQTDCCVCYPEFRPRIHIMQLLLQPTAPGPSKVKLGATVYSTE